MHDATYKEVFQLSKELFDPKYPYKASKQVPSRMENEFADYFQLTFFLIAEKLKGEKSFFEPFVSYLPKEIHTLYTYPDDTKIAPGSDRTLLSELQFMGDDIFDKIK